MFSQIFPEAGSVEGQTKKKQMLTFSYLQHITSTAQVKTASACFIPCLLYVGCVQLWQRLQGVDCELKEASGPSLLSCDWLASRGPVDELDSDSKLQIAARQPPITPLVYFYYPTAPHP